MTTKFTTIVTLMNGELMTFKGPEGETFEMQDRGLFFIHSGISKETDEKTHVRYRYTRFWIPYVNIKSIQVMTTKELSGEAEVTKYKRFLEHGIDMMMTPISHTARKDPAEVAKQIEQEEKKT